MGRLNHPVYRNRVLQVLADAALVALSFYLAFRLRFLDTKGVPPRYETLLAQAVGFVIAATIVVFAAYRLYQKWVRYLSGCDCVLTVRAAPGASSMLRVAL